MANDDFYTVTSTWTAVEANGADITNGTFSVVALSDNNIMLLKTDTAPTALDGGIPILLKVGDSAKYTLGVNDNLYAKTLRNDTRIGVVPA